MTALQPSALGSQEFTRADLGYSGSRYADVREAIFRNPYYKVWGGPSEPDLPIYNVTLMNTLRGILPFGQRWRFKQAAQRALDSHADLRWGRDNSGFRRILHPNGVCLFGRWIIDTPSQYSGYFRHQSEALIIGRFSTCCTTTKRKHNRSLSMVGKLYPTSDSNHQESLRTANFITQDDIGGRRTEYVNDVELRNAPDTTPLRRGWALPTLLVTGLVFMRVDREPTIRQLYPIAELGKPANEKTRAPNFMRLTVDSRQPRADGETSDFRDEILAHIYDRGDPAPKRKLTFTIEVTDEARTSGKIFSKRTFPSGWNSIGRIEFHEAVASYNGDFVIHFNHPPWRTDRNDPATVVRSVRT